MPMEAYEALARVYDRLITPEERDRMKYRINEKYSLATPSNPPRSIQ